jgi:hypothetical protein
MLPKCLVARSGCDVFHPAMARGVTGRQNVISNNVQRETAVDGHAIPYVLVGRQNGGQVRNHITRFG